MVLFKVRVSAGSWFDALGQGSQAGYGCGMRVWVWHENFPGGGACPTLSQLNGNECWTHCFLEVSWGCLDFAVGQGVETCFLGVRATPLLV